MTAKEKAIKFLETKCKWCKDWEEIQEVKDVIKTIDIAIKEAKKEVFDDIDKIKESGAFHDCRILDNEELLKLKKKHLGDLHKSQKSKVKR